MAYSGTLTTAQQAAVNGYLDAKWLNIGSLGGSNFLPTSTVLNLSGAGRAVNLGYGSRTVAELHAAWPAPASPSPPAPAQH